MKKVFCDNCGALALTVIEIGRVGGGYKLSLDLCDHCETALIKYADQFKNITDVQINGARRITAQSPQGEVDHSAMSIEELDLTVRSFNALRDAGILTIGQLCSRTRSQLLVLSGFGPSCLNDVDANLYDKFKMRLAE